MSSSGQSGSNSAGARVWRVLRRIAGVALALMVALWVIWSAGALYFDLVSNWPAGLAPAIFFAAVIVTLFLIRGSGWRKGSGVAVLCAGVLAWWLTIEPSNQRNWQPNVSRTAWAEIDGDRVTLHNIRDVVYRSELDYTPEWRTRTFNLSDLQGVDMVLTYWGSPWIAHPFLSFRFGHADPVAFSIETRMEEGEAYSTFGGFYRQFELIYVVAEERDVIRLRTDYRKGEDAYLFRIAIQPQRARAIFMDYLETINRMHRQPVFYNALTSNCTTGIRMHAVATTDRPRPWNWRILLPGKVDELMYMQNGFQTSLPLTEYKKKSHINPVATGLGRVDGYSTILRQRVPSYHPAASSVRVAPVQHIPDM